MTARSEIFDQIDRTNRIMTDLINACEHLPDIDSLRDEWQRMYQSSFENDSVDFFRDWTRTVEQFRQRLLIAAGVPYEPADLP